MQRTVNYPNLELLTGLGRAPTSGSSPDVKRLQNALIKLSAKVPAANPGSADGVVGPQTWTAVLAAINAVPKIPSTIRTLFTGLSVAVSFSPAARQQAEEAVLSASGPLAMAIEAYLTVAPPTPAPAPVRPKPAKPARPTFGPKLAIPAAGTRATALTVPGIRTTGTLPTSGKYPVGTLYYFEPKTQMYMVALPISAGMRLGQATQFSGGETHTAPTPVVEKPEAPAQATTKTAVQKASGTQPIYKKWWFWTAIGAGTLAAGGTTAYFVRR